MLLGMIMHAKALIVGIHEWHIKCMDMLSHNITINKLKGGQVSWVFLYLQHFVNKTKKLQMGFKITLIPKAWSIL